MAKRNRSAPIDLSWDLEGFLRRQDASTLVSVLVDLAKENESVRQRLDRLRISDRPAALAERFRDTLEDWRRSSRYFDHSEAHVFGQSLLSWLEQIERELVPIDPAEAVRLYESFIEADADFFNQADDSNGDIGDAIRSACRSWLQAASQASAPSGGWASRLRALVDADEFGAREELLRAADMLLSPSELRGLVEEHQRSLEKVLAKSRSKRDLPHDVFRHSAALSLLSEALHDPDVMVRATLTHSPEPNELQREGFVRAYLTADRPADALRWLEGDWSGHPTTRDIWKAQALGALGRATEAAAIQQQLFDASASTEDLQQWMALLPEAEHAAALSHAREVATREADPIRAALLLMDLGDAQGAEDKVLSAPQKISGGNYYTLVPLAQQFSVAGCWRAEVALYRALLTAVLTRGYAPAYRHGALYWQRLEHLALAHPDARPLAAHDEFFDAIRDQHRRKTAFWARVREVNGGSRHGASSPARR